MKRTYMVRIFLFTVMMLLWCLAPAFAAPPSLLKLSPISVNYQDKDLVLDAIITNVGPTASLGIVDCTLDVYDAGKSQIAGAYFQDENLKKLSLHPGQATRWTFALPNPKYNKDLSKFSVDCSLRAKDAPQRHIPPGLFLYINSQPVSGKTVLKNKRVLAPFREVFEMLGATVHYHKESQTITATLGNKVMTHQIGTSYIYSDKQRFDFDTPSIVINGNIMFPVRLAANAIGNTTISYAETGGTFVVSLTQYVK